MGWRAVRRNRDGLAIDIFSTCPPSTAGGGGVEYLKRVIEVARWSEEIGCRGILVYSDNSLVDPWLVSQAVIQSTRDLCPLVAVQPIYMHPYTVAKMIASLGYFHGRRVYLNMVAGGFKNDLNALNDPTPHDRRYDRLVEYTTLIKLLLSSDGPVSYSGEFYQVQRLRLIPALPAELFPGVLISGSSEAGLAAAKALGATAVMYPRPVGDYEGKPGVAGIDSGVRIGIIARETAVEAWAVAHERFPEDRKGQIAHQLAMKVSDSVWHRQLSEVAEQGAIPNTPYWLVPFQNYKTFCPYLVGSYDVVASEVAGYVEGGHRTFILDVPAIREDLAHVGMVFKRALEQVDRSSVPGNPSSGAAR
jgi:alkanesulfonate monooxygenase